MVASITSLTLSWRAPPLGSDTRPRDLRAPRLLQSASSSDADDWVVDSIIQPEGLARPAFALHHDQVGTQRDWRTTQFRRRLSIRRALGRWGLERRKCSGQRGSTVDVR